MNSLVTNLKVEWRILLRCLAQPRNCLIGKPVGHIPLECLALSIDVESGIHVDALPGKADPVVETGARVILFMPHMPFADVRSFVARCL